MTGKRVRETREMDERYLEKERDGEREREKRREEREMLY